MFWGPLPNRLRWLLALQRGSRTVVPSIVSVIQVSRLLVNTPRMARLWQVLDEDSVVAVAGEVGVPEDGAAGPRDEAVDLDVGIVHSSPLYQAMLERREVEALSRHARGNRTSKRRFWEVRWLSSAGLSDL